MKKSVLFYGLFAVISLTFLSFNSKTSEKIIGNFTLKNTDNKTISLNDFTNAKGFIIVFTCNKCPMAKLYTERLKRLNAKFKSKGVYLLTVNSMDTLAYKEESFKLMQKKVAKEKIDYPYLQDKMQVVAKQFGATHTPQAYIIWKNKANQFVLKYQGAIDDSALEPTKGNNFLEIATDELVQNKNVSNPKTESVGCRIYYRGEVNKMD